MDKEKLKDFLRELSVLENKHGISIIAGCDETIDYDWDESPYTSGYVSFLIFCDEEGNEMTMDNLDIDDLADI